VVHLLPEGQVAFQTGAIMNPRQPRKVPSVQSLYAESKQKLDEVNKLIKEHDKVTVKFR